MSKPYIPPTKAQDNDYNDYYSDFAVKGFPSANNYKTILKAEPPKKPLKFQLEGKEVTVYGGSCHEPKIKDADVYVSLDRDPPVYDWEQPWFEDQGKKHIRFKIQDMSVPTDTEDFKSCIEFLQFYVSEGKKVHVGCIGGNGRTGMILSALIQSSMGDNIFDEKGNKISAIDYVRDNYSSLAVETVPQILFLHYNFGVKIPKDSVEEVADFNECFKKKIGVSLDEVMKTDLTFDQVSKTIIDVDNYMYSQLKFVAMKNQKPNLDPNSKIVKNTSPNFFKKGF